MKKIVLAAVLALAGLAVVAAGPAVAATWKGPQHEYVVLYEEGVSLAAARLAVRSAGGVIVRENTAVGVATVTSVDPAFRISVLRERALEGAARSRPIGTALPNGQLKPSKKPNIVERLSAAERRSARQARVGGDAWVDRVAASSVAPEPLAPRQWDMRMIHATADGSYAVQPGDPGVRVGIIDTGIDGTHPDLAPNFDGTLSRNFTMDIPFVEGQEIDGPCEFPSCVDPNNWDDNSHGTHVAGTVGAALNGLGIAGVAPKVTLVNLRAGQDSGFFFLQPSVDALTYAGDHGIDVVNMSYFIDPWLYNCADNPADSPAEQQEQRTIIAATQRALDYAYENGVTLVAALGNEHTNIDNPTIDTISPDFPPGHEKTRNVDNSCLTMPTEGNGVIGVVALGPSTIKADYSNYGTERTIVSAPGGYFRDLLGTPQHRTVENLILSTYPERLGRLFGDIDPGGNPTTPFVVRDCQGGVCAYYQYLQGTSMASPHAAGVAAVIVSGRGHNDPKLGGLTEKPKQVEHWLVKTATDHACPDPPLIDYGPVGRPDEYDALCVGTAEFNNIWGHGIVDALAAAKK
jgi:subtilisin family serine protease